MFSALKEGNIIYLLHKGEKPELRIGTVVSVSSPSPKNQLQYPPEMVVSITANFDGESVPFNAVPASLALWQYQPSVIIAESREEMRKEVEALYHSSKQILDNIDYHKSVVESCDSMLKALDPQYAKDQRNEERFVSLEGKVESLCNSVEKLVASLNGATTKKKD